MADRHLSCCVRELPLKNTDKVAIVDAADFDRVSAVDWKIDSNSYVVASVNVGGVRQLLLLHRFILQAAPGTLVDHKNRDPLDNSRNNLRLCTHAENMRNRKARVGTTSGERNVVREGHSWRGQVRVEGKRYRKRFPLTEAGKAAATEWARQKRLELHGEFAADLAE